MHDVVHFSEHKQYFHGRRRDIVLHLNFNGFAISKPKMTIQPQAVKIVIKMIESFIGDMIKFDW